ncbi:MAG: RNA methyltransferase [Prevotella sp.]|nr:RNA methyltransferase [Prevotella sp.]
MEITENYISSVQNPKIKLLTALQKKSSERRSRGLFVVEGVRELQHCVEAGFEVESVFCCREFLGDDSSACFFNDFEASGGIDSSRFYSVSPKVYEHIAYRGSTEGVVAVVKCRERSLDDLELGENPLLMVLESVEKPGNLGAVLRSADAARADAVIVCDPLTDLYNPNLIRASIGAVFTVPVVACDSTACIDFLKSKNIKILTAQLQDSSLYYETDMRRGVAIVMGTESTGLTQQWRLAADAHIRIPMLGRLDSLNVSVSAAILLFEAVRQRKK